MKLSEAIEALFQGAKITKTNGSWGKDYIYWDWNNQCLLNKKNQSYEATLSTLMFVSQDEKDCWTIVKEKRLIPFGEMPAGALGRFEDESAYFIKINQINLCNLIIMRIVDGCIIPSNATGHQLDNYLVEYPIDTATP